MKLFYSVFIINHENANSYFFFIIYILNLYYVKIEFFI